MTSRLLLVALFACAATSAQAKWDYCYYGTPPAGVNEYPEMPPRSFGFGYAAVPYAFKRLCGHPAQDEADHVRRIVRVYLECSPDSDLAQEIETGLTASDDRLILNYFPETQTIPATAEWHAVCEAAKDASSATLAFGDTWYYDSPTPDGDSRRVMALFDAIDAWSATREVAE